MKQNQLITKTLVVVALLLVGSSSTYAQFGNLLNRAKNAAKREAVKQANDAQWEAKNKALREVNEKKREEREKAKAAAEEAASATNQAKSTASNAADMSDDGGSNVNITWADFGADYSIAKKTDWSYDSPTEDVLADVAYWLQRVKISLNKGNANAVDFEALGRVNNGAPLFSYVDKQYHQTASPRSIQAIDNWSKEKDQVVKAAWKVISAKLPEKNDYVGRIKGLLKMAENASGKDAKGYFFDRAFEVTSLAVKFGKVNQGSDDESTIASKLQSLYAGLDEGLKGNYPSSFKVSDFDAFDAKRIAEGEASAGAEVQKMRKGSLLKMYQSAASAGRYVAMPAAKGNSAEAYVKQYVEKTYPEWGKVIRVSAPMKYNVVKDKLGNILYRQHGVTVVCEDQGYKAVHGISLREDYKGGRYQSALPNSDRWNSGPLQLMK